VANRLTADGSVRKEGTRLFPAGTATGGTAAGQSGAAATGESQGASGGQAAAPAPAQTTPTDGTA
jgi:hypothetical protein